MGEMITDVGIDLDGVLYPFAKAFNNYCCERMGRLFLPEPTHWNFYEDWDLDEETFYKWLDEAAESHQVFATEEPYQGVAEAWDALRQMDVRIHIITSRPQASWEQTAGWLTQHGLKADSLHFNKTKGFLTKISNGKSALIDDHIAYYREAKANGIFPVLMNRSWNQSEEDFTRVNNLLEFAYFIRGYNLVKKAEIKKEYKSMESQFPEKTKKSPHYNETSRIVWWNQG